MQRNRTNLLPPVSIPNFAARPDRGAKFTVVREALADEHSPRTHSSVASQWNGDLDVGLSDQSSSCRYFIIVGTEKGLFQSDSKTSRLTHLRRSQPAAYAEPFIGGNAFSVNLAKRKTDCDEVMTKSTSDQVRRGEAHMCLYIHTHTDDTSRMGMTHRICIPCGAFRRPIVFKLGLNRI